MKRAFDIVAATVMLGLSLPGFCVIAIVVRLTSEGPVFFEQERWGRNGFLFRCLKFRTMVPEAEDWLLNDLCLNTMYKENGFKLSLDEDPRITKVGQFLRKTYLDELPQLINVMRGEMSIVGPRPIVEEELEWYGDYREDYLSIKPGIFGAWTAQGRRRVEYPARASVELDYVRNTNMFRDCQVLLQHVPVLTTGLVEGFRLGCSIIYNRVVGSFRKIARTDIDQIA